MPTPKVKTTELRKLIEDALRHRTVQQMALSSGVNYDSLAKAIYDVRNANRPWTTYWRADLICSGLGHPEYLHGLTQG